MSPPTDLSIKAHIIIWTLSITTVGTAVLLIILSNPKNGTLPYLTPLALSLQSYYREATILGPLRYLDSFYPVINPHIAPLYLLVFFAAWRAEKGWLGSWVVMGWNAVSRLLDWVTDLLLLCGLDERWRAAWWFGRATGRGAWAVVGGWVVVVVVAFCGAEYMGWRFLEFEWWEKVTKKDQGDIEAAERGEEEKEKWAEVRKGGEKKVHFQEL